MSRSSPPLLKKGPAMKTPLATLLALLVSLLLPASVLAQGDAPFPSRPVRIVVPFTAGGPTDVLSRMLADRLSAKWRQAVIVENRPGGGSTIGTNVVAKAAPDGYTIGMVVMAHVVNPAIRKDLPYDTLKDFAAVSQITSSACVLVAHPSLPANTVGELIAMARDKPGTLTYATPGTGTLNHVSGALLAHRADIELLHVPYGGSAAAHADVLSGRVPLMFDVWAPVKEYVKSGRLKVLGMTVKERLQGEPDYPTIAETLPGFEVTSAFGIVAPSQIPRPVLDKLGTDIAAVVKEAAFAERVRAFGMEPVGSSPDHYNQFIRAEVSRWSKVVRDARITVN